MNIGKIFGDTWSIYSKNFFVLTLAGIVALLLCWLLVPIVGFQMMFVKAKRGETIVFKDMFSCFGEFWSLLLISSWMFLPILITLFVSTILIALNLVVVGIVNCLFGFIISCFYFAVIWIYALLIGADKKLAAQQCLAASKKMVRDNGFWPHLFFLFLVGIVFSTGSLLWGALNIIAIPFGLGAIACAYEELAYDDESK